MSIDRREFIAAASAAAGAALLPGLANAQVAKPSKPLHILILGGTGLTGPHQVRYALSRGHKVTLFNRGRRPKEWPAKVEELTGDREVNEVKLGLECGVRLDGFEDAQEGDIIECYTVEKIAQKLE